MENIMDVWLALYAAFLETVDEEGYFNKSGVKYAWNGDNRKEADIKCPVIDACYEKYTIDIHDPETRFEFRLLRGDAYRNFDQVAETDLAVQRLDAIQVQLIQVGQGNLPAGVSNIKETNGLERVEFCLKKKSIYSVPSPFMAILWKYILRIMLEKVK